jgi:hypothetical protein
MQNPLLRKYRAYIDERFNELLKIYDGAQAEQINIMYECFIAGIVTCFTVMERAVDDNPDDERCMEIMEGLLKTLEQDLMNGVKFMDEDNGNNH